MDLAYRIAREPPKSLYQELREHEIRLLIIRPSPSFSAPLRLSMHTTDFSNKPVYKALSYVWGSPDVTSTIIVNNIQIEATTNLVSALRHIRHKRLAEILWVDAVCINQFETSERNHQVQLMSKIYLCAHEVIAWLGESKGNSDEAMDLLARWGAALNSYGMKEYGDLREKIVQLEEDNHGMDFIASIEQPFSMRAWNALSSIYERPYWRRLWIFQEFVLAKKVSVMCGSMQLNADHLLAEPFFTYLKDFYSSLQ